jgi:thiamine biosynthesis lipoprotein
MGTTFRMVFYARSDDAAREGRRGAFDRIAAIDAALSDYRRDSEVMRLCHAAGGDPLPVSKDFVSVWRVASRINAASDGAFDVTAGPLTRVWRRARRQSEWPDTRELETARALTGARELDVHVEADGTGTARLARAGMCLDFGGIAKGYAATEALASLQAYGIESALVAAAGDIALGAPPPDADGWTVAIAPLDKHPAPGGPLVLSHAGVSTSGDAEQWLDVDGVRYSHIIDPRTGRPLTGRRSVTVIARDATWSDALATAVSVVGRDGFAMAAGIGSAATLMGIEGPDGRVEWSHSENWDRMAGRARRTTARHDARSTGIH